MNRYQASKQADVLMLGHLFSSAELRGLFDRLGYDVDDETWRRTVDHYLRRTSHGSTLSGLVHGLVLARARRADAWRYVREALEADIADIQGGTTGEGIHLGAMAGTLDLVQRGLTGLETREDALHLDPVPLPALSEYSFSLRYRGHWGIGIRRREGEIEIEVPESAESPIRVVLAGRTVTVAPGRPGPSRKTPGVSQLNAGTGTEALDRNAGQSLLAEQTRGGLPPRSLSMSSWISMTRSGLTART